MKVDEPDMQVTNMGSSQTRPPVKKAENTEEHTKDAVENVTCTEGFKYISTMSSFEDLYFKETVKNELFKDKKVTWRAFCELSPASV